ncbi:hypothetical protein CCS01_21935 [Rhodopila globiformis]|uniref:Uncharacterized protein n=2 Tax=Rhodopila globiformis TaxID=1071 RepID=A0A2S6N3Z2_RHOGL|nr:hypothetical protein CCS01_21935 [Rhodopila globiformis]
MQEIAMSESDDISARLTALETVVSQLITHLAVRSDDPAGWVETRKVLALTAVNAREVAGVARLRDAVSGFFHQAESVAEDYSYPSGRGTPRPFAR